MSAPLRQQSAGRIAAPAFVLSLVVMAPVLLAADTVASVTSSRPVVLSSQSRADELVRCVSEAARKLYPVTVALPSGCNGRLNDAFPLLWTVHVPAAGASPRFLLLALPGLIDLPPPTL
jgi:hypothetical protein